MVSRWLLSVLLVFITSLTSYSQIIQRYDSGYTYREVVDLICDDPDNMCNYFKSVGWNDSQIKQYTYRGMQGTNVVEFMNWRMVFPLNYDNLRAEGYPIILMLHGGGESGRKWGGTTFLPTENRFDNNGYNVIHGGQAHLNAVNRNPNLPNAFPGIVIWPQVSYNGAWESGWDNGNLSQNARMTAQILEWVIQEYNVDPDRIAVHGLSNGGKGSWDIAAKRPDLFAAVLPMSGVGSNLGPMAQALVTTPLWLFQGGNDTNPRAQAAVDWIAGLQQIGGNPRYTLYPNLGHGTWNTAYAEPDFFSWILEQNKKNIYVYGGDPSICPGGSLNLGFSANMLAYQWVKDGVDMPGANTRFLTTAINGIGTYKVKYKRRFGPDVWIESNSLVVGTKATSTFSPTLTNTGSIVLPIKRGAVNVGGVNNIITFTVEPGYASYYWFKDGNPMTPATTTIGTRSISNNNGAQIDQGIYTVKVLEATGCVSSSSNSINVSWNDPQPANPQPTIPTMTPISSTSLKVDWSDVAGETGYEIWRLRLPTAGYNYATGLGGYVDQSWRLLKILPENTITYTDEGLRPQALYKYMIRALHSTGGATFSSEPQPNGVPLVDSAPPTVPQDFVVSDIEDTQVTLSWALTSDNDVVSKYQIFDGVNKFNIALGKDVIADTVYNGAPLFDLDLTNANPPPPTTFILKNLTPLTTYFLSVRAVDHSGNVSAFSDVIPITTSAPDANGVSYKYHETSSSINTVGTFNFNLIPKKIGTLNVNTSGSADYSASLLAPRDRDTNIVFEYLSKIQIDIPGIYTFYTTSDDGSRLFIAGQEVVNNDGPHGMQERSGTYNFTSSGRYDFRVIFAQGGGGSGLFFHYQGPTGSGVAKQLIPNSKLWRPGTDQTITYYFKASGVNNILTLSNWGANQDGSGTAPTNFTSNYQKFVLRNNSPTLSASWSVSGIGSKVVVENGQTFTIGASGQLTGTLEANDTGVININTPTSTAFPKFGLLAATSTVNFNTPGNMELPIGSYGHVNLGSTSFTTTFPINTTLIKGNLEVGSGITTTGNSNNQSVIKVGGNISFNNANPFPSNPLQNYSLVFTGNKTHTVSFATAVAPTLFSIQTDFGDSVNFTNLSAQTFTVGSNQGGGLTLKGGSTLNLGNNNLTIIGRGTINNNNETGALSMQGGNITLNTTATQNNSLYFSANAFVSNLITNTPAANRASILTTLNVNNLVTVNGGELNAGEGYLVLRSISDAVGGTARIGPLVNGGAKVTGKINAQRYMSGEGRIYRYISSPVKGITAATLQQQGIPITGNFTGVSTGPGITSGTASMFRYVEPGYVQFPAVGSTNLDTLRRGVGYTPFIREASVPTVMSLVGEPYQGTINFTLIGGTGSELNGWNLLGNPYAAPVQWTGGSTGGWTMTGLNNTAYVRENSNTISGGFMWKSHNGITGTGGWNGLIAPGQAFWVRATAANPTLTISESAKKITDGAFFREDGSVDNTLEIIMTSATAQDAAIIQFIDGATPAFDTNIDGAKQSNSFFNLSTLTSDNRALVINQTTLNYCAQEIKLRIVNAAAGTYGLSINGLDNIISGDKVTLIDNFLQTEKLISEAENLSFTITSDAASKADGRFTLRFAKPEVVLNQTLKSNPACEQTNALVLVGNSQPGVSYQAFFNGAPVTEAITSIGGILEIPVNPALVGFGTTTLNVKGGFKGCNSFDFPMQVAVTRDTLTQPEIIAEPLKLIASSENASYQWYFNGEIMDGQTERALLAPADGLYFVEVTLSSCSKVSDTVSYVITSIEKPNRAHQLYPNPTRDKVIVALEQAINFESLRVISSVGQMIGVPVTRLSAESAEVDFINLPVGLYLLQVNGQHYRVLKE